MFDVGLNELPGDILGNLRCFGRRATLSYQSWKLVTRGKESTLWQRFYVDAQ